jgi:hypothetical protein
LNRRSKLLLKSNQKDLQKDLWAHASIDLLTGLPETVPLLNHQDIVLQAAHLDLIPMDHDLLTNRATPEALPTALPRAHHKQAAIKVAADTGQNLPA